MADATLKMLLLGEDRGASKAIKGVGEQAKRTEAHSSKMGKAFGGASLGVRKLVGAFAGLAIASKATSFIKDSVAEARESQKVSAITGQVIKTTGQAAHVSAKQVGELATAISNKSGIDDEAIQTGANLLLTFKNIKNEAGKGNDIFSQTTGIMTDMAAAMGKDPKSAAIGLGKALNDPIKGVSALAKVGVTFDESQKATIKRMVESGNVMGAQKIILKELKSEFGGAAAASATSGEKAAVAWGNLKEQIGTQLLPIIDKLATWLSTKVLPAVSKFVAGLQAGEGPAGRFRSILEGVVAVVKTVAHWIGVELVPFVRELASKFMSAMGGTKGLHKSMKDMGPTIQFVKSAMGVLWAGLKIAGRIIIPLVAHQLHNTIAVLSAAGRAATALWNGAFAPALRMIVKGFGWVVGGIASMLRALGYIKGFGWATRAADSMDHAADKARRLADNIRDIPKNKHVTVTYTQKMRYSNNSGVGGADQGSYSHRAVGGSVRAGQSYWVGERNPELFTPTSNGRITPESRRPTASTSGDFTATQPIVLQLDGKKVWHTLLEVKRRNGNISMGLA